METTVKILDEQLFYELYKLEFSDFINEIYTYYYHWINGTIRRMGSVSFRCKHCEDMLQEALIAIEKAWQTYKFTYGVPFDAYVKKNIVYKLLNYKRQATNLKNGAETYSLEYITNYDYQISDQDMTYTLEMKDYLKALEEKLSPKEQKVLKALITFDTSKDMANHLGTDIGSVYNATARIKNKIVKIFENSI